MILDLSSALICAGVFCLAAVIGGARAAEVYPGCAVPPTTFNHIWYIDPVNGKTPADGRQWLPGRALELATGRRQLDQAAGLPYPMLSTVPYDHYPQTTLQGAALLADGPSTRPHARSAGR